MRGKDPASPALAALNALVGMAALCVLSVVLLPTTTVTVPAGSGQTAAGPTAAGPESLAFADNDAEGSSKDGSNSAPGAEVIPFEDPQAASPIEPAPTIPRPPSTESTAPVKGNGSSAPPAPSLTTTSTANDPSTTTSTANPAPPLESSGTNSSTNGWPHAWGDDPGVKNSIDDWITADSARAVDFGAIPDDDGNDSAAIQAALDSLPNGGVVLLPAGVLRSSETISLSSGQVLRGEGAGSTEIRFTESMEWGIEMGGGYAKVQGKASSARKGSSTFTTTASTAPTVGAYAVLRGGTGNAGGAGEVVQITGVSKAGAQWNLTIAEPLSQTLDGGEYLPFAAGQGMGVENLSVAPAEGVEVDFHIVLRSSANSWVRNVESRLARRAHIYTRQTANCEIRANTMIDARFHGDGGMGYGINLANRTTGCLVVQNRLSFLRHSMLLHDGATANVVAYNTSTDPRHPNFVDGGPADMSFHGIATANLVEGNIVERVQLTDAGVAGSDNTILRNCFTSGPPTLKNSPIDARLIGNTVMGNNAELQARIMPAVDWSEAKPYTQKALFDSDGILAQGEAPGLVLAGNWFSGSIASPMASTPRSAIQRSSLVPPVPTGDASTDCPYAPVP